MNARKPARWALWVVAVPVAFLAAMVLTYLMLWLVADVIDTTDVETLAGSLAAAMTVATAFVVAPDRKLVASALVLLVGSWAAWLVIDPPSLREVPGSDSVYTETYAPILVTYAVAVGTYLMCVWAWLRERSHSPR